MRKTHSESNYICYLLLCILTSIFLYVGFSKYTKSLIINDFYGIEFEIESNSNFVPKLYYSFGNGFSEKHVLHNASSSNENPLFKFPKGKKIIKKFRLDLGSNKDLEFVKLKKLTFLLRNKKIEYYDSEVFKTFFLNSSSTVLDRKSFMIKINKEIKPNDPYIIFKPLASLVLNKSILTIILTFPFFVFLTILFIKEKLYKKLGVLNFLFLLFLLSIPLKIAWTTFISLLICFYGLVSFFKDRKNNYNLNKFGVIVFVGFFLIEILIGRPFSIKQYEKIIVFILFVIINSTVDFKELNFLLKSYIFSFIILISMIVSSGIGYLFVSEGLYGIDIIDYFKEIKTYSGNIRDWMYYDHAAFLSFFGIIGLLISNELVYKNEVSKRFYYLYNLLLLLFIILVGSRVSILIYLIFNFNFVFRAKIKKFILVNSFIFCLVSVMLFSNIHRMDLNRSYLWSVSWEAIKEKPWMGYGLGKSDSILHDFSFINKAGFFNQFEFNHSHNQFISSILEIGVIGVGFVFLLMIVFLIKSKLYKSRLHVLFCFGLGYVFLTESILLTSKPLFVVCLLFTLVSVKRNQID